MSGRNNKILRSLFPRHIVKVREKDSIEQKKSCSLEIKCRIARIEVDYILRVFLRVTEHIVFLLFVGFCILALFWTYIVFRLLFLLFYAIRAPVHTEGTYFSLKSTLLLFV